MWRYLSWRNLYLISCSRMILSEDSRHFIAQNSVILGDFWTFLHHPGWNMSRRDVSDTSLNPPNQGLSNAHLLVNVWYLTQITFAYSCTPPPLRKVLELASSLLLIIQRSYAFHFPLAFNKISFISRKWAYSTMWRVWWLIYNEFLFKKYSPKNWKKTIFPWRSLLVPLYFKIEHFPL